MVLGGIVGAMEGALALVSTTGAEVAKILGSSTGEQVVLGLLEEEVDGIGSIVGTMVLGGIVGAMVGALALGV
jgi:hypothetical protein